MVNFLKYQRFVKDSLKQTQIAKYAACMNDTNPEILKKRISFYCNEDLMESQQAKISVTVNFQARFLNHEQTI